MAPFPIAWSLPARADFMEVSAWWAANRPLAPTLLRDELVSSMRLLRDHPEAGARVRAAGRGVRRLVLTRSRYLLLYRVDTRTRRLIVLALWHPSRGSPPPLR